MKKERRTRLFIDQFGKPWFAKTVAELRAAVGGGRVYKMYMDRTGGSVNGEGKLSQDRAVHVGYVVGSYWCTEYAIVEQEYAPVELVERPS